MSMSAVREPELGAWTPTDTGEPFGEWKLPGMGDPHATCGEVSATTFCDEHGHVQYEQHQCGRRECPDCWSSQWAGPRTVNVVSRLAAARYAAGEGLSRRMVHAVVSPPDDALPNTIEGFYEGRRRANEIAKEHGIRGGVVVAHGYRPLDETWERYQDLDPDLPLWRWIRSNGRPWKEQVYWSPHFHIVGLSRDTKAADSDDLDGWVFRKIRSLSRYDGLRDRDGIEDMIGVVRYLLSHATFPAHENRQAVTWFGSLHGTNFDPEDELSDGTWSVIERITEEIVGSEGDNDDAQDERECPVEDCTGTLHDIWNARMFLDSAAGQRLDRDERRRVQAAYLWVVGDLQPPPGMKNPRTKEEAAEVVEHLRTAGTF